MTGESGEDYLASLEASRDPKDHELAKKIREAAATTVVPNQAEQIQDRLKVAANAGKSTATLQKATISYKEGAGEHKQGAQKTLDKPGIEYIREVNKAVSDP